MKPRTKLADNSDLPKFQAQMARVFRAFQIKPATMYQVSKATNVDRANICRYVAQWKKEQSIYEVFEDVDPMTGFKAVYYSTDPKYKPTGQLQMFQ